MNLTSSNYKFFNYDRLSKAKPGAIFVNVARGEFSPCPDLLRLLDEGRLGGVGLDVYNEESKLAVALRTNIEPQDDDSYAAIGMSKRPNAILTPHNAFNTIEAVKRKAQHSAMQIESFLDKGAFIWPLPA